MFGGGPFWEEVLTQDELDQLWQESFLLKLAQITEHDESEACEQFMRSLEDSEDEFLQTIAHRWRGGYRGRR